MNDDALRQREEREMQGKIKFQAEWSLTSVDNRHIIIDK